MLQLGANSLDGSIPNSWGRLGMFSPSVVSVVCRTGWLPLFTIAAATQQQQLAVGLGVVAATAAAAEGRQRPWRGSGRSG